MLRKFKDIKGLAVRASDGEIGKVHDLYFDDRFWRVRYLVDDTGKSIDEHYVLIPPTVLGEVHWEARHVHVGMTMEQVKRAQPRDEDPPVEKQPPDEGDALAVWPYMGAPLGAGVGMGMGYGALMPIAPIPVETAADRNVKYEEQRHDPHLRSAKHVLGYRIHASDGEIGHVEDLIVDDSSWTVRYLEVDTRNWWPGKKVLVSPHWIERLGVESREVHVNLEREVIKSSPEYKHATGVSRDYETALFAHYGRKGYWV